MAEQLHRTSRAPRIIASVFFGLTVAVTLLSGLGTTCVAFAPFSWSDSMAKLAPYQPLYIAFVVIGLACGGAGIWVLVGLARNRPQAYRNGLIVLLVGGAAAAVHMAVSQSVRGSSAPINMRVYITALTLLVWLLLRLPPIWTRADFGRAAAGDSGRAVAGGTAMIVAGLATLTTPVWVGSTHIGPGGERWVDALAWVLPPGGWGLLLAGIVLVGFSLASRHPAVGGQERYGRLLSRRA